MPNQFPQTTEPSTSCPLPSGLYVDVPCDAITPVLALEAQLPTSHGQPRRGADPPTALKRRGIQALPARQPIALSTELWKLPELWTPRTRPQAPRKTHRTRFPQLPQPSSFNPFMKDLRNGTGASRLAALLLPHIVPLCSVVAPCHPGAALRKMCQRISGSGHSIRLARAIPGENEWVCRTCSSP